MTNYNDGKWHGWNGGECPVHPETLVEVMWKEDFGGYDGAVCAARKVSWGDIDAFRASNNVIKEHKEPREWFALVNKYGDIVETASYVDDLDQELDCFVCIVVREVMNND